MRQLTRREMMMLMGASAAGAGLASCNLINSPVPAQAGEPQNTGAHAPHDAHDAHASQGAPPQSMTVPPGFEVDSLFNVFDLPVAFQFLPDGRILIVEKAGMLKMIENGIVRAEPVIDIRGEVNDYVDRGFIDVGVDPEFTRNHYLYLLYTYRPPDMPHDAAKPVMGHLVRYELEGNVVRLNSAKVLLDDYESTLENHSVDSIRWSLKGDMFVSFGDGAVEIATTPVALAALDIDDLRGKMVRIDKETGDGLPGNPYYDPQHPHSARSRVWTYGLRNPFRFAVHPGNGIPYIGNVGDISFEMLNRGLPGVNYCWPCVEGMIDRPDYQVMPPCEDVNVGNATPADYIYPHNGQNACIIGGDFNFSANFPPEMHSAYFLADYSLQWIKYALLNMAGQVVKIVDFATGMGEPVDLKFGPDGFMYYMSIYSGGFRRVRYTNGPRVPEAKLAATPIAGSAPLTVTFSAAGTTDPQNSALSYAWDFGDGAQASGADATHTYQTDGQYLVRLTVKNALEASRKAETLVTVGDAAPVVRINSPGNYSVYVPGQQVSLSASATDLLGTALPKAQTNWHIVLLDGTTSRGIADVTGTTATFQMPETRNDGAHVEALFSAQSPGGKVSAAHLDLYPPAQDGYIRSWWISTGFPFSTLDDDRLPGGEAHYIVKPGDPLFRLVRGDARTHKITLIDYITPNVHTLAYAFVWVDVPEDRKGLLGMMSDDGIAVWLNGKNVWRNKVSRFMPDDTRDIDLPAIELKKGLNALLVKVDQNVGDWAFKVRVLNPDGSIMPDATVKTIKQ